MKKRNLVLLLSILVSSYQFTFAQTITTPTPAPTKTATEVVTQPISTSTEPTKRTFTQSDLSVIAGNVQRPNGIVWFNKKLYVVCTGDWTIYEIDDTSGETRAYIYNVRNGHDLYAETDENNELTLWVPDFGTNQLLKINPVRSPQPIAKELDGPWGIAYMDTQNFLITSLNSNTVNLINRDGETKSIVKELRSPTGIAIQEEFVYVANSGSARRAIEWFDRSLISSDEDLNIAVQPLVSGLQSTTDLVMAADGMLYFAYSLGTRGMIGRIDPEKCRENGGCTNDEIEIVVYTDLAAPLAGLTISPDMRLYVHTMFRPEIYSVQLE